MSARSVTRGPMHGPVRPCAVLASCIGFLPGSLMSVHDALCSAMAAVVLLAAPEARADSFRCAGGIVAVGDSKLDLLGKCGRPTLQDGRLDEHAVSRVGTDGTVAGRKAYVTVETWSYDFGPEQFTYSVTLDGGRIVRIERGGYGYGSAALRPAKIDAARCDPARLDVGDAKLDLLAKCGEPFSVDVRREEWLVGSPETDGSFVRTATRESEVWIYDFGPRQFLRVLELEDGKVTRVDTGGYGYGE